MKHPRPARLLPALALCLGAHHAAAANLFDEARYRPLTADRKAHAVGDALTVLIYENTTAAAAADTSAGHDAGIHLAVRTPSRGREAGLSLRNEFDGRGATQRSGRVLAQLTVIVREKLPNGDLVLAGTQTLEINNERQTIRIEGRVRPNDITESNTVLSTRVADARISLSGDGVVSENQRPSWWQRLLTLFNLGPSKAPSAPSAPAATEGNEAAPADPDPNWRLGAGTPATHGATGA